MSKLNSVVRSAEVFVDIVIDAGVADFFGGADDFADVVGKLVKFAVFGVNGFELFFHLVFEEFV